MEIETARTAAKLLAEIDGLEEARDKTKLSPYGMDEAESAVVTQVVKDAYEAKLKVKLDELAKL